MNAQDVTDNREHKPSAYEIRIWGHLDTHRWADWFEGLTIKLAENGDTILTGPVTDQAALYGLLRIIRDLGMPLISINPKMHDSKLGEEKMTTLVVGASGATGRLLVEQLLDHGEYVKAIVRSLDKLPDTVKNHPNLTVIHANLLDLSDDEMVKHVSGCDAVASCLGHNLNFKGVYGQPRRLVTDATRRLCNAIKANEPAKPVKFVLMNTAGNSNRDLDETISFGQRSVTALLRLLLPPHVDNEQAADFLRTEVGQSDRFIEWSVVRPDNLIDENKVTPYDIYASPIRDAIFDSGQTSRINVGHFMAELIMNDKTWHEWKGQMPVIYNRT